ncbi:nucleoside triphosphate pyrophosphohydrolase [Acetobacter peroxydans]|uniref:nucleoside triphosphate pyrophosphohydrolase n=1 Tax=Acetobacter peroxydans TaxID=104098 RepID=UPI0023558EFD|nr:nucleoside triphosphate pyrophosphohydrolase [Acetobacter peroxydans]MCH4143685.1 nucleoside triphosphate pyrophosphohydrolase [Acetobacter peroxydans]MCI1412078.1 nucleoside triphosphate pyrophosphohydrolase [Acetobacter peroxydans]MCI1439179.1 nucleoside triphosphate pyrophosphohydrolase [Acetobacter peroxydans]MCI1567673.1 nucleoside triphosphate pyrophosphohydrolase [Acetobacter peroxydans]MCI1725421.1 nucleoside triphosphate pyrophosphohydrolase [Acetobacter peroxydans]
MAPDFTCILRPPHGKAWFDDPTKVELIGYKARGLSLFPENWRPPFVVLTTQAYVQWVTQGSEAETVIAKAAEAIERASRVWHENWPRGLILRSSACKETLEDRGSNQSIKLAADYSTPQIREALTTMFRSFSDGTMSGNLAVVIQPLAGDGPSGHLSNERRLSKTVNQWRWERFSPSTAVGGVNSQRDSPPDLSTPLNTPARSLPRMFGSVGRWVTDLQLGPAHLEWTYDDKTLWLLQIDFEREQPDDGIDPKAFIQKTDCQPTGALPSNSPLVLIDTAQKAPIKPWRKIENVKRFAAVCHTPYPPLATITGDRFRVSLADGQEMLTADIEAFAHGRVVCRTDCKTAGISRENLPRTDTVSSASAVTNMTHFLDELTRDGASAADVCFLLHKFIPAQTGVWARADPNSSVVRIDSLWGVPDGLQYLPHDTFDVDVKRKIISGERIRFKPRFIQECSDGTWRELKVRRSLGRTRSLSKADAISVAEISHTLASQANRSLLVMWFCGIPTELGIGSNLPWFSMPPNPEPALQREKISPQWPRKTLRSLADVCTALETGATRTVLVLDPELSLFRNKDFLLKVIQLADRDQCPVELAGSTLAHAHYQLEKAGITVVPSDAPTRSRARGRRSYAKLVRDDMPDQIAKRGEVVVQARLPRSELRRALAAKLLEETQELLAATDPDDVKAELGDLLEIVKAIANVTGVSWTEVETTANEKRRCRGGFEEGAVLVETEWPVVEPVARKSSTVITLSSLGKTTSHGHRGTATYNALLATDDGVKLEFDKRLINVRLTKDGISIELANDSRSKNTQLTLPI